MSNVKVLFQYPTPWSMLREKPFTFLVYFDMLIVYFLFIHPMSLASTKSSCLQKTSNLTSQLQTRASLWGLM